MMFFIWLVVIIAAWLYCCAHLDSKDRQRIHEDKAHHAIIVRDKERKYKWKQEDLKDG